MPSRVLLDEPYPENLPWVYSCSSCNLALSLDEEYIACLVECTRTGSVDPSRVQRPKVRRILADSAKLRSRLLQARSETGGSVSFRPEFERVKNVVLKLARGHALYELNERHHEEPLHYAAVPMDTIAVGDREHFEAPTNAAIWPEVGSRAMQRLAVDGNDSVGWQIVQPGRYRYLVTWDDCVTVRMVLSEYLACEVAWVLE
jgi:hypothetical protein